MSSKENQTKALGELTTFYEMLASHDRKKRFDEIVIPKIQRDYAQGRSGRSLMRSRFLKRLFSAIDRDGAKEIKLDFVYGQANDNMFFPIDGQQRLTTLIDIPNAEYAGIRDYVENQWWFTSRWSTDPTISSMMVMLDDIDLHYRDWSEEQMLEVWKRLTNKDELKGEASYQFRALQGRDRRLPL